MAAHCRRRKIRCLVAEGDPQSRCQNCIRLKKECVFYPVDQQSAVENKSQSSGKAGGASSTVSSSPPEVGVGRPFEEPREAGGFPTLPSNAPPGFPGLPLEQGTGMPHQGNHRSNTTTVVCLLTRDSPISPSRVWLSTTARITMGRTE